MKIELNELSEVKGIGKKTINRVKRYVKGKEKMKEKRDTSLRVTELQTNAIHCGDNIKVMREKIPDESIDLTVTSPPYDNLRDYEGEWDFNFKGLAQELYRVTKKGGVVVWVVNDATVDGSETGNSFKQALYFKKIGFNLHDTMIYAKENPMPLTHNRYEQQFEFMFVFSKNRLKTFNPIKKENKCAGEINSGTFRQNGNKLLPKNKIGKIKNKSYKNNIWYYKVGRNMTTKDKFAFEHPAMFPEKLAEDHIKSWSNEGDVVLDPMCGSGTTLKMANKLNREYIGIDISQKYCDIAKKRLKTD